MTAKKRAASKQAPPVIDSVTLRRADAGDVHPNFRRFACPKCRKKHDVNVGMNSEPRATWVFGFGCLYGCGYTGNRTVGP